MQSLFIEIQGTRFEVVDQPFRFGRTFEIKGGLIYKGSFKITKKRFGQLISYHQYGRGIRKVHAIFFDYKQGEDFRGYRFMFYVRGTNMTKSELTNCCYDHLVHGLDLPWFVNMKYAEDDSKRFKVPLSL